MRARQLWSASSLSFVLLCLAIVGLTISFTACGSNSSTATCQACGTQPAPNGFLFAVTESSITSGQILSFPLNGSTGALGTPLSIASPTPPLGQPFVAGQSRSYLYLAPLGPPNGNLESSIYGYSIDAATGALTALPSSPFAIPDTNSWSGSGFGANNFVYLGALTWNPPSFEGLVPEIQAFTVGSDGSLTSDIPGAPFPVATGTNIISGSVPQLSTLSPYIYASEFEGDSGAPGGIAAFTIDSGTGALTSVPGSPFSTGPTGSPGAIIYDPLGFVYVVLIDSQLGNPPTLEGFAVNSSTGGLTLLPGSPVTLSGIADLVIDSSGQFLFTGDGPGGQIEESSVDPTTGSLTPLSATPGRIFPPYWVYGNYLYATTLSNLGEGGEPAGIAVFSIDENTGALTEVAGSPFPANGEPIVSMTVAAMPEQ